MREYLEKILAFRDLSRAEAEEMMERMTAGDFPPSRSGALLAALRMKGESLSELVGAARFLRRNTGFIDCGGREVVDVVGTGGDGGISFNISTAAAFVAAGAGVVLAKHGNRAVSGKCGAADVLAELGFDLDAPPERMEYSISRHGIGFLFAPRMHPRLAAVAALRRELGFRTIFNLLGPLCNPAGATAMVLGVCDAGLTELFASALSELGVRRAMVVHGHDGLDEISCCAPTRVSELKNGVIRSFELFPEMLFDTGFDPAEIAGGDASVNARILKNVLSGRDRGAARAIVTVNAGAAILVAERAEDLREGMHMAEAAIDSGAAMERLESLIAESRRRP